MKSWQTMHAPAGFAEITDEALRVWCQGQSAELPLARRADGRLQNGCKESLLIELRKLLHKSPLQSKVRLFCGVSARGLSLRRLTIPVAAEEARRDLLALQVESEFPLPPAELAWGSASLNGSAPVAEEPHHHQVLVAAVRKQTLEDFVELFAASNTVPVFVPAAFARAVLCPQTSGRIAHLEVQAKSSELLLLEDGNPAQLVTLPWRYGVLADVSSAPNAPTKESAPLSSRSDAAGTLTLTEASRTVKDAASLAALLRNRPVPKALYLSGLDRSQRAFAEALGQELGIPCEIIEPDSWEKPYSTAIAGLAKAVRENRALLRLNINADARNQPRGAAKPFPVQWAVAAVLLVLLAALFPYLEAYAFKPGLAKKLAALKADRGRLAAIDNELEFLRAFKQMQPAYLDALYMVSRALPAGSRFDTLSLNRRGELSLKGSVRDVNQMADFRAKLLDSGLFSTVAVEEQSPTPDRQKLLVRITAQCKLDQETRQVAALNAAKEPERPKSVFASSGPGMMPPGMMPPGMMPSSFPGSPGGAMAEPPGPGGPMNMTRGAVSSRTMIMPAGATRLPPGVTLPGGATPPGVTIQSTGAVSQPLPGSPPAFQNSEPSPTSPNPQ